MSIQASWLTRKWTIDLNGIKALEEFSLTKELDVEELAVKDGKSPTNTKGFKPQGLVTSYRVSISAGVDPLSEFEAWEALCGKRGGFHVAGRRMGPPALILDKVEFTANAISNAGQILDGQITLTFSEDVTFKIAPPSATSEYKGEKKSASPMPGYQPNGTQAGKSAYNVRPSASAKETKL